MHRVYLSKLLKKFKKDELLDVLSQKGYLDDNSLEKSTKATIINRVLKRCEGKLTKRQIAELDLIYHQNHSKSKEWNVHFLAGFDMKREKNKDICADGSVLERILHNKLRCYFQLDTCVQSYQGALWVRLSISDVVQRNTPPSTVYIVYYPSSTYLMMAGVKETHKEYIFQALCDTLGCTDIKLLQLSGKDVYSLADMVLNKTSQGSYSNYKMNRENDNPLLQGTLAKRKKYCKDEKENTSDDKVIVENKSENEKNKKWLETAFGTNNKQPVLEKVTFVLDTKFKGTPKLNFCKDNFKCRVKFEGPSVIEGIKNLGEAGIADLPLPPYLANIQSSTRNHFLLVNRKRARQTDNNSMMSDGGNKIS